jgi:phosphomannomutase
MNDLPSEYKKAFRGADIRGIYPTEINETFVYRVGAHLVTEYSVKSVVVGRDMRESSPSLHHSLCRGIRDAGADVVDIGRVPTPLLYHASGKFASWGVMLTASHNPASYNGLKIVQPGAVPLTGESGLRRLQRSMPTSVAVHSSRGAKKTRSLWSSYTRAAAHAVPLPAQSPLRILVDAGNGMSGLLFSKMSLPAEVTVLNQELDGSFPARGSNPMLRKNQTPIRTALRKGSYDLGIACDGDGDRVAFFDGSGRMYNSAAVGALLATRFLKDQPGASAVYTVFTSKVYEETIAQAGGHAVKAKVGHGYIKEKMKEYDAVFACEHSGHFYFRDNYHADSVLLALRTLIAAILETGDSLHTLLRPYTYYTQTEEVLVPVRDKRRVLRAVQEQYRPSARSITVFDGVSVYNDDHWFVVKPSVTEDALKFVVEAPRAAVAKRVKREVRDVLQKLAK